MTGYWNPEGVLVQWCEKGTEVQLLEITSDVSEEQSEFVRNVENENIEKDG